MDRRSLISIAALSLFPAPTIAADLVTIENEWLSVAVDPMGAELQSVRDRKSNTEYLWQGDPEFWQGRAPIMFPVNVRFKDERFSYRGTPFEMPRMGLAIVSRFEVLPAKDDLSATFRLESSASTKLNYPFDFILDVSYVLEGNRLRNEFTVSNTGSEVMYFALGGHPGFRTPLRPDRGRGAYELSFSKRLTLERSEISDSLIQPSKAPFLDGERAFTLDDPRIPNGGMFQEDLAARRIGVGLKGGLPYVTVDLGDFPNVNIWTPPGMPFVCIEPMVGHHDLFDSPLAIENKSYLVELDPGERKRYAFTIIVRHNGDIK